MRGTSVATRSVSGAMVSAVVTRIRFGLHLSQINGETEGESWLLKAIVVSLDIALPIQHN